MRGLKITVGVVLAVLALTGAVLLAWPAVVQAQTPAPTPAAPGLGGPDFDRHGALGRGASAEKLLVNATVSVTGLTQADVLTALQTGQSLTQIAEGKGKTAEAVIQAARTQLADQLKQAVTAGTLTQAQADSHLQRFDQTASQVMSATTLGRGKGFGMGPGLGGPEFGRGHGFGGDRGGESAEKLLVNATVSVTGLTQADVLTALQTGQSLTQIAEGKGKTADAVIQAARTQLADQLKQAVTAGTLTQAQADSHLQRFDQTASQIMASTTLGQHLHGHPGQPPAPATPTAPGNTSAPQPKFAGPSA